ncbi:MAG: YibE/F family protein [Candidatus Limnocylindria bacterium]
MRRLALLLGLALSLAACADPLEGTAGRLVEARVVRVLDAGERPVAGASAQLFQRLELELEGSLYRGDVIELEWGGRRALNANGLLAPGDRVLLTVVREGEERQYAIQEVVRLPSLLPFAALLLVVLLLVARLKGAAALAGLAASVAVFLVAIVPAVRRGDDPLAATLVSSAVVLVLAVLVVHGLNRKSLAALLGTLGGLAAVVALAAVALPLAKITGLGTEEAIFLSVGSGGRIDMPRLVLAGVIVGSLGALVDMAVGQASTTFELAAVDRALRGRRLYLSALNVGRDHIGSLINTLAFAYFGGALPLIVLLSLGFTPLAAALNSEEIVESVIAVLVASAGLVLCVPLTTAVAVALARD